MHVQKQNVKIHLLSWPISVRRTERLTVQLSLSLFLKRGFCCRWRRGNTDGGFSRTAPKEEGRPGTQKRTPAQTGTTTSHSLD